MSVRRFCSSDINDCKNLWLECFPDDADFCDFYFSEAVCFSESFIYESDGKIAGYLASFPFKADYKENCGISCRYLYGISVLPDFRGKGFMKSLMQAEADTFKCTKLLIPAVDNLYERFGYKKICSEQKINIENRFGNFKTNTDPVFLNEVYDFYRKRFDFSLRRSQDWWKLIIRDAINCGWEIAANDGAYAFFKDGQLKEFAYTSEFYRDTLDIGSCVLTLPQCMSDSCYINGSSYVALMLD